MSMKHSSYVKGGKQAEGIWKKISLGEYLGSKGIELGESFTKKYFIVGTGHLII